MLLWVTAGALGLIILLFWAWAQSKADRGAAPEGGLPRSARIGRVALVLALAVAFHAAFDPDHDKYTFQLLLPQVARATYAFAVTMAFLMAFHTLRIGWGALIVAAAAMVMEALQAGGVLPGHFRIEDAVSAVVGVAAAAAPMWIGAHRARVNMARDSVPPRDEP